MGIEDHLRDGRFFTRSKDGTQKVVLYRIAHQTGSNCRPPGKPRVITGACLDDPLASLPTGQREDLILKLRAILSKHDIGDRHVGGKAWATDWETDEYGYVLVVPAGTAEEADKKVCAFWKDVKQFYEQQGLSFRHRLRPYHPDDPHKKFEKRCLLSAYS